MPYIKRLGIDGERDVPEPGIRQLLIMRGELSRRYLARPPSVRIHSGSFKFSTDSSTTDWDRFSTGGHILNLLVKFAIPCHPRV